MVQNSNIEWTDHTFNPWVGCEKISPACTNCYAESWAKRAGRPTLWAGTRSRTTPSNWRQPVKWNAKAAEAGVRARVFCASLADVFDNAVDIEWRADLFELIHDTPHLDWQLLTKRIGNARGMIRAVADWHFDHGDRNVCGWLMDWHRHGLPPANIWLGATIANQEEARRDLPKLLDLPARVRFLSCEPLLGELDFEGWFIEHEDTRVHENVLERIDWVIVGGESGGNARSMWLEWAELLVAQCQALEVPVFVKQLGANPLDRNGNNFRTIHAKGGDMREWPAALRVREFPI